MCGITGFFNSSNAAGQAKQALQAMQNRGINGCGIATEEKIFFAKRPGQLKPIKGNNALGHVLHSVVGEVKQPLKQNGLLSANCEIYNWKGLAKKHGLKAKNDAELVLNLLKKEIFCRS